MNASLWTKLSVGGAAAMLIGACTVNSTTVADGDSGTPPANDSGGGGDSAKDSGNPTPDTGTDTGPAADGGSCPVIGQGNGQTSFGSAPSCDACMSTNCCTEATTCFTDVDGGASDCANLAQCVTDCIAAADGGSAQACEQGCQASHPNSVADYNAVVQCEQNKCTDDAGTGICN